MYKHFFKRFLDILLSFVGLLIALVPMLIIALAIKIDSRGPVIFKQERIGKNGKVFRILKFRSMCVGAERTGSGVYSGKGDARVTRVGRILRATSLDEIPQLLSVLKGDMSFIGPRPTLANIPYEQLPEERKKRLQVRPGITGYAQAYYRNSITQNEKVRLACHYVDNVTFIMDVKIILQTVKSVLKQENIYVSTEEKPKEPVETK